MGKEQDLEKQLAECRKAKNALIDKIADCMQRPDTVKATLFNAVAPMVKARIEERINQPAGGDVNLTTLRENVFDKTMEALLGTDWKVNLERV